MERKDSFSFYMDDADIILMDEEEPFIASDDPPKAAEIMGITEAGVDALLTFIDELKDNIRHDLISLYQKSVG